MLLKNVRGYSNSLAELSDTVVKTIEWSALILTCSDATVGRYVVSITPEEMAQYTYTVTENCNFQASWVINVRGEGDIAIRGGSFPGVPGGIVYNIVGCERTVDVTETEVSGHLLAPCSTLHQTGGVIVGKVVAQDITFALQINKHNDCPNPGTVTVPTPTTEDVPALSDVIPLRTPSFAGTGDQISVGGQTFTVRGSNNGNLYELVIDGHTQSAIPAGSTVKKTVDGSRGQAPLESVNSTSSGSALSVAFALIFALLALF